MAETMQFDLVAPERKLLSGAARMVVAPGVMGDIGVMPGHAPFVTTLRPGVLQASIDGGEQKFVVFGGFVEVSPESCTVLADDAVAAADFDKTSMGERIAAAEKRASEAEGEDATRAAQYLLDLRALETYGA